MIIEFRIKSLRNIRPVTFLTTKAKMTKSTRALRINVCICEKVQLNVALYKSFNLLVFTSIYIISNFKVQSTKQMFKQTQKKMPNNNALLKTINLN